VEVLRRLSGGQFASFSLFCYDAEVNEASPHRLRQNTLSRLASEQFDLLVLGGGIVGAGVARDAALRGLRVALIDKSDFAQGTSSRSSRLLHGGIRYLAQGRLALVREASLEKRVLASIAPHLVQPLAFVFPAYQSSPWPFWQLRIGVKVYDLLCGGQNLGKSEALENSRVEQFAPGLSASGRKGAVRYFDGFTQDARLVLDTLRSAANAGASVANYVAFEQLARTSGQIAEVRDVLTNSRFPIRAAAIVNATGPWAQNLGLSRVQLRLTKGIHLVFERSRFPVQDAVVITSDQRILFVIPWGERVITGTTDTDYNGDKDQVVPTESDAAYVLANLNAYFPDLKLGEADIVSSWAGLRPLISHGRGRPSDISRSHEIIEVDKGWWDVAGGKLTTYRLMAEQTVDKVVAAIGKNVHPCSTKTQPLLREKETVNISGVVPPSFSEELIRHFCENEWAIQVDDIMQRRAGWRFYFRDSGLLAEQTAAAMAQVVASTAKLQDA
jgi:glycerol-3-phosphate dehydrogenase